MERSKGKVKNRYLLIALALFVLICVSSLAVSGQDEEIKREESVILEGQHMASWHFNPYNPSWNPRYGDYHVGWESLYYYWPDSNESYSWLCTGWNYSTDFKTLKWFVRPGVKWNDGQPFTAKDIVYTLKMIKYDPNCDRQNIVRNMVDAYTENNDLTAVVVYSEAQPLLWLEYINTYYDGFLIVAQHIYSKEVNTGQAGGENLPKPSDWAPTDLKYVVRTGPYKLYSITAGGPYVWKRNDDYWGKGIIEKLNPHVKYSVPKVKWVIWKVLGSGSKLPAIINNEIDTLQIPQFTQFLNAYQQNNELWWVEHYDWNPLCIYVNLEKFPWNYVEARWALAHSINQTRCIEFAFEGLGYPSSLPQRDTESMKKYIPDTVGQGKTFDCTAYDPNELTQVLTNLGCSKGTDGFWYDPNGTKLAFECIDTGGGPDQLTSELVASQLRELGLDVVHKTLNFGECMNQEMKGEIDLCVSWQWGRKTMLEPFTYFRTHLYSGHGSLLKPRGELVSTELNIMRWHNDTFDDLIDETWEIASSPGFKGLDDPKFIDQMKKLYTVFYENLPIIPLYQNPHVWTVNNNYWKGWPDSGGKIENGVWTGNDISKVWAYAGTTSHEMGRLVFFALESATAQETAGTPWWQDATLIALVVVVAVIVIGSGIYILRRKKRR